MRAHKTFPDFKPRFYNPSARSTFGRLKLNVGLRKLDRGFVKPDFELGFYKSKLYIELGFANQHARSDEEMLCKCFDKCSKALAINTG